MPLELTICTFTVQYWNKDINAAVWITVFYVFIVAINIFGTLGYAEEEFVASLFKLIATIIFMIVAVVLICGGGPADGMYHEYWGARLWYDPGAFQNGFRGFCAVFVTAAFSFGGTELVGLAAAEAKNPGESMPGAVKQIFWRVSIFYILGLALVGLLVSSTDERLLNFQNPYSEGTSMFVIAGKNAGLKGFDSFMNVLILVSVISICVSSVFAGSRTITSLAQQGYAPKFFDYIDRSGRPLFSVLLILAMGPIAYIALASSGMDVFSWLYSLCSLCLLFTWGSICGAHIRFRAAWVKQGRSLDAIPYKSPCGVWGSWLSLALVIIFLAAQIFVAIAPPGTTELNDAEGFFRAAATLPVILVFWIVAYLMKPRGLIKLEDIDLDLGARDDHDWDTINAHRAKVASWSWWRRAVNVMW
jgi:amino acid transporter